MKLKALWYCTKPKNKRDFLCLGTDGKYFVGLDNGKSLSGKIGAMSNFHVEEIGVVNCFYYPFAYYDTIPLSSEGHAMDGSCLSSDELWDYLRGDNGYAIHIKNLNIFDKPKELSDFYTHDNSYDNLFGWAFEDRKKYIPLKKAPQNMCYAFDKDGNKYVLISVRPEWLCLILNGLKDVELRRKVLKEML